MTLLVLITGFLGAGKTTLLRQLIPPLKDRGLKVGVILNDYANADVDSVSLRDIVEDIVPISGSCVCCGSLDELLMSLENVDLGKTDVVLVETNGTTDPLPLIEMLLRVPAGQRFGALMRVHVIDCLRWQRRESSNELERRQTQSATHAYYTWESEQTEARRSSVRGAVNRLNSRARETTLGALSGELGQLAETPPDVLPRSFVSLVDPEKAKLWRGPGASTLSPPAPAREESLSDLVSRGVNFPKQHHASHDLAHRYTALELPRGLDADDFSAWVDALPPNVIRAKGVVEFTDKPGRYSCFQRVEETVSLRELPFGPPGGITLALLVGIELDEAALRESMQLLTGQRPMGSSRRMASET